MSNQKKGTKKNVTGSLHGGTDFQNAKRKHAAAEADFQKNRKPHSIHRLHKNISK